MTDNRSNIFQGLFKEPNLFFKDPPINVMLAVNPLRPSIKLQILLSCFHTFITDLKGSCSNINRISFE